VQATTRPCGVSQRRGTRNGFHGGSQSGTQCHLGRHGDSIESSLRWCCWNGVSYAARCDAMSCRGVGPAALQSSLGFDLPPQLGKRYAPTATCYLPSSRSVRRLTTASHLSAPSTQRNHEPQKELVTREIFIISFIVQDVDRSLVTSTLPMLGQSHVISIWYHQPSGTVH
jgi:hypothetical protein